MRPGTPTRALSSRIQEACAQSGHEKYIFRILFEKFLCGLFKLYFTYLNLDEFSFDVYSKALTPLLTWQTGQQAWQPGALSRGLSKQIEIKPIFTWKFGIFVPKETTWISSKKYFKQVKQCRIAISGQITSKL